MKAKSVKEYIEESYRENSNKTRREHPEARIDPLKKILFTFEKTKPTDDEIFTWYLGRKNRGQNGNHDYTVESLAWMRKVKDTPEVLCIAKEHGFNTLKEFRSALRRVKHKHGRLDIPYRERKSLKYKRRSHYLGNVTIIESFCEDKHTYLKLKCNSCGYIFIRRFRNKSFKRCPNCKPIEFKYRNSAYWSIKDRIDKYNVSQERRNYLSEFSLKYTNTNWFECCFDLFKEGKISYESYRSMV